MSLFTVVTLLMSMTPQAPPADPASKLPEGAHRVDGRIKEPKKTKDVRPEWPPRAKRAGLNGVVLLECTIDLDGAVTSVKPLKGYKLLVEAATEAVKKWRYTPTLLNGRPVPVIMTVTANFRLSGPPSVGDLLKSMKDEDPELRWAAVQWLGAIKPPSDKQRKAVEAALQDDSPLVRQAAELAQKKLDEGAR